MLRNGLVFGLLVLIAGVAGSADDPPKAKNKDKAKADPERIVEMLLARFDTNKDGKISKSEAQGRLAENFDALDKNKDGFLDREELKGAARLMAAAAGDAKGKFADKSRPGGLPDFDSLDKNADGRLTRDEVKGTALESKFDEIDTNKDGKIDPKEYAAYRRKTAG